MPHSFLFSESQFNKLFPFYLLINRELKIVSKGTSISKLIGQEWVSEFDKLFTIKRPLEPVNSFQKLVDLQHQLTVLESSTTKKFLLRGQFELLHESQELLFVGSPWFSTMEQVTDNNLLIDDFACHDPLIDLLHLIKSQEITTDDLKQLVLTINEKKNDLKKANKEIYDIALFPKQSLDPLIRINFEGDIISNNPSAANLDFFDFKNKTYRNDEFFKLVACTIDKEVERWVIEASSNNKDYSFECITMKKEEYINIYGKDITQQKKDRLKLERLSLVASANTNGVLFTTPEGYITWANEGFCNLTGYSLKEVIGKSPIELCKGPLSDKATLGKIYESFFSGNGFSIEIIHYRKDKSWFWGRSMSQPLTNEKGKVTEFFTIFQNVTDEKSNEEKLKVLSQIAQENINPVIIADKEGKIAWVNKSFVTLTGYTLEEGLNKKPGQLLQGPDTDKSTVEYLRKQINNGEPFNTEIINYSKAGHKYWLRIQGQPIKDEKGELTGFFALEEDVTKEKESQQRFRQALENIGDNVWEHDVKTGKTYYSNAENDFLGYTTEEINNNQQLWLNSIHKEDRHLIIENNRKYKTGSIDSHNLEYRIIRKDGNTIWVLDRGVAIEKDRNGNPIRITGTHTDITERKNSEAILEKQRKFYEDILNNMPADIAVFGPEHEYLYVNPSGIKDEILRKWVIGKQEEDFFNYRNKPLTLAIERRARFDELMANKTPTEWEEKFITPVGDEKIMLRRYFPVFDAQNNVALVIGYGIDITERKKIEQAIKINEEKYRGIITNMNLGLMETDGFGKITFANQMLLQMTGLKEDEVIGFNSLLFLSKESLNDITERIDQRAINVSEAYEVQTNINTTPGWWLVSSAPKLSETGERIGSIVICLDITNQKKLEQDLIKSTEQAEQLAKAKEIFLANMSHEIRTPMNAIMGMGNQLAKTPLTQQQNFYLSTINTAAENLLVIINDILDLSKIDAGKLSVEKIGFEPKKVIANAMQVLMHKAEEKGLSLTNSFCDTRISPVLIGDPYRLTQVMLNLISNAIKFTEHGNIDIVCEVINDTETSQKIKVLVADTGIGMEKVFMERLFDKFSQEYESTSRRFGGTGLGMSISKELIELMGGSITVQSRKGKGTTVTFEIEFKKGALKNLPGNTVEKITAGFLRGKTILVTDDNDMNRLVASTILNNYGATTIESVNGEESLSIIKNKRVDLILMDIQMPVLNGYDATKQLRIQGNTIPIIALTANAIKGENEKCIEAGMNDYIAKPFKEDEFLKKIAHWLSAVPNLVNEWPKIKNAEAENLYDLSGLIEISHGNNSFVEKMVTLFCTQSYVIVSQIKKAYEDGNLELMGALAHKLKPSIDSLKIESLKEVIRKIEKAGKENIKPYDLLDQIQLTNEVITNVVIKLKQQFSINQNLSENM